MAWRVGVGVVGGVRGEGSPSAASDEEIAIASFLTWLLVPERDVTDELSTSGGASYIQPNYSLLTETHALNSITKLLCHSLK